MLWELTGDGLSEVVGYALSIAIGHAVAALAMMEPARTLPTTPDTIVRFVQLGEPLWSGESSDGEEGDADEEGGERTHLACWMEHE